MDDPNENAAVTIMSYGLRPGDRSLVNEAAAIKSYRNIFKGDPVSAAATMEHNSRPLLTGKLNGIKQQAWAAAGAVPPRVVGGFQEATHEFENGPADVHLGDRCDRLAVLVQRSSDPK